MESHVRISKLLSAQGLCSRREADHLIEQGWVLVDGKPAQIGQKVSPEEDLVITEKGQDWLNKKITIVLNKPVGVVSAQAEKGYQSAADIIVPNMQQKSRRPYRGKFPIFGLAPAGRLDIDSQGLLVLTQDGVLAKKIIGEDTDVEKEYVVKVSGDVTEEKLEKLRFGLRLDGKPLKRAGIEKLKGTLLSFILKEGKKRQIRRMCEQVDLKVIFLKRIRIGRLKLGDLEPGQWRILNRDESV